MPQTQSSAGYNTSHTELRFKTARNHTGTHCDCMWQQLTKLHDSDTSQWHTVMCNSAHLQWPTSNTTHNQGNSHTPTHTSALSQHSSLTSASSDTHLPTHTHHNIECQHTHNTLNSATHKLTGKSLSYVKCIVSVFVQSNVSCRKWIPCADLLLHQLFGIKYFLGWHPFNQWRQCKHFQEVLHLKISNFVEDL